MLIKTYFLLNWSPHNLDLSIADALSLPTVLLLALYGFCVSSSSFSFLAAVPFMPIGDLIVVSFTSPVFSVFIDRVILKRPLTWLSVLLCFLIIAGSVFVIQPPFLFDANIPRIDQSPLSSLPMPLYVHKIIKHVVEDEKRGPSYFIGVGLCLYVAVSGALANVLATKCKSQDFSTPFLMFVSGCFTILLSLLSLPFFENRLLTFPTSLDPKAALLLPVASVVTMVAFWTITLAINYIRNPTLISMLRSTEIMISLVTESFWWHQLPGLLSLFGSLLVSVSVLSMTGHDAILAFIERLLGKNKNGKSKIDLQNVQPSKKVIIDPS
jgi:drug/metabolite transporter (DMT)-like permease